MPIDGATARQLEMLEAVWADQARQRGELAPGHAAIVAIALRRGLQVLCEEHVRGTAFDARHRRARERRDERRGRLRVV